MSGASSSSSSSNKSNTAKKTGSSKPSVGRASTGTIPLVRSQSAVGPGAYLPPVMDDTSHHLLEMQRKMLEMQNEISRLRTAVMKKEVEDSLDDRREAAQNPLTFEEKRNLIAAIHVLPSDKMQQVIDIIQQALPPDHTNRSDEGDVEVPLDDLDTFTLRQLQRFIEQEAVERRKRSFISEASIPTLTHSTSAGHIGRDQPAAKKQRKESVGGKGKGNSGNTAVYSSSSSNNHSMTTTGANSTVPLHLQSQSYFPGDGYGLDNLEASLLDLDATSALNNNSSVITSLTASQTTTTQEMYKSNATNSYNGGQQQYSMMSSTTTTSNSMSMQPSGDDFDFMDVANL